MKPLKTFRSSKSLASTILVIALLFFNSTSCASGLLANLKNYTQDFFSLPKKNFHALNSLSSIGSYLKNMSIESHEELYGNEDVSPEDREFINNIAKEMGFNRELNIKKFNQHAINVVGYANAFAIVVCGKEYIYISEDYFKRLSHGEKRFLIGHELTHLLNNHLPVRSNLSLALIAIIAVNFVNIMALQTSETTIIPHAFRTIIIPSNINSKTLAVSTAALLIPLLSISLAAHKIERDQEYEADMESALKLNSAEAGISFLQPYASLAAKKTNSISSIFASHPKASDRIARLKALLEYQKKNK